MRITCTVPLQRFEKYGVFFPEEWEIDYLSDLCTDEEMIASAEKSDVLFVTSMQRVSRRVMEACPGLRLIHVEGVSFDKVDVVAAAECGIPVCNNKAVNCASVAEHSVGLMLAGLRHTARVDRQIRAMGYAAAKTRSLSEGVRELNSQHVGLIGLGVIGREIVSRLRPFGCRISYYDVVRLLEEREKETGVGYLPFEELLHSCDIISVQVPVLPSTVHMLSGPQVAMMKPTALVINVSRGEIIDNEALAEALEGGRIFGAALDTVDPEPMPADHVLLNMSPEAMDRLTLTPHIGGMTDEAFGRMLRWAIANFRRLEKGEALVNAVNP